MILRAKRLVMNVPAVLLWVLVCVQGVPGQAEGYVVPPEQLLDFMAENVAGFETLSVTWERSEGTGDPEAPAAAEERVWFRRPGEAWIQRMDGEGEGVPENLRVDFLELFSGRRAAGERFLVRSGVAVGGSAYTRVDRTVAYRIGGAGGSAPALFLEKSRFLPLALVYEPPNAGVGEVVELRFQEYQKTGEGWFPHEILYTAASGVTGILRVKIVRPNAPFPESGPPPRMQGAGMEKAGERTEEASGETSGEAAGEKEPGRLERVIRAFEEKYGD
jgi:hypothetical protein